jgi:hypothetical protein
MVCNPLKVFSIFIGNIKQLGAYKTPIIDFNTSGNTFSEKVFPIVLMALLILIIL